MKKELNILTEEKFLIVDNAMSLSKDMEIQLNQICTIGGIDFNDFKYDFTQATDDNAFEKISASKNILVSTTFTTIKSEAVEDLIYAGVNHQLKDKDVFSLMQYSLVGDDFEYYNDEVTELYKNNVKFYFLSEDYSGFELYIPKLVHIDATTL